MNTSTKTIRVSGSALEIVQKISVKAGMSEANVLNLLIKHGAKAILQHCKRSKGEQWGRGA